MLSPAPYGSPTTKRHKTTTKTQSYDKKRKNNHRKRKEGPKHQHKETKQVKRPGVFI